MNLVLAARSTGPLEQLATNLRESGVRVLVCPTDVSEETQLKALVDNTMREFGSIDVLVNNAGIGVFRPFQLTEPADISQTIQVNLVATLLLTRFVLPHMLQAGRGHIVNMASIAGKFGPAFGAAYGASKAGISRLRSHYAVNCTKPASAPRPFAPVSPTIYGIYAEVIKQRTGRGTPWYLGSTSADAVGRSVVKAIRQDRPEMIINFPALRPVFAICQAFPRLGELIKVQPREKVLEESYDARDTN